MFRVCTLRAAIMEANALAGADEIDVPAGAYLLTLVGGCEDASATGDLDVSGDLVLRGAGSGTDSQQDTIVLGVLAADRNLHVLQGARVEIAGMRFAAGDSGGCLTEPPQIGGIWNEGSLHLAGVSVSGNDDYGIVNSAPPPGFTPG